MNSSFLEIKILERISFLHLFIATHDDNLLNQKLATYRYGIGGQLLNEYTVVINI